jgi:hypothetical protein
VKYNPKASAGFQSLLENTGARLQGLLDDVAYFMSCGGLLEFGLVVFLEEEGLGARIHLSTVKPVKIILFVANLSFNC